MFSVQDFLLTAQKTMVNAFGSAKYEKTGFSVSRSVPKL